MTNDFESQLGDLFAAQPELPDAMQFARQVEHELDRTARRLAFAAVVVTVMAAGVTFPLLGRVLRGLSGKAAAILSQTHGLTLDTSLAMAAGMMVIGALATAFGRYQAARL